MKGRPSRMTPELDAIFAEQAQVYLRRKSLKKLAQITGYSSCYCWHQIQRHVKQIKVSVSAETDPAETSGS